MAKSRISLHHALCRILGSTNCYFNPPSNIVMQYPCIVYGYDGVDSEHADNKRYVKSRRYTITVIDYDPDSAIPDRLLDSDFEHLKLNDSYTSDGLYHFLFTLYY